MLAVLSLLALASIGPAARALAPSSVEELSVSGTPLEPALQSANARLLAALRSKIPIEPIAVKEDPYEVLRGREPLRAPAGTVCGVRFEMDLVHYRLATFAAEAQARTAGFAVTHVGACGTCSTLQDLAVYLEKPDLTAPVRACGMKSGASARLACLEGLGFSAACARTWLYDVENTRRACLGVCMSSWFKGEASTRKDGRLNSCLQCDEDHSGPVFKATAGRTRRNSGIRSSIPRPNEEIAPVVHDYVPGATTR